MIREFSTTATGIDSLPFDSVRSILQTTNGDIFLGTPKGLCRLTDIQTGVQVINLSNGEPVYVTAMLEDAAGHFWVGTAHHGLLQFDRLRNALVEPELQQVLHEVLNGIIPIQILQFDADELWIGTFNAGLIALNTRTGKVRHFRHSQNDPSGMSSNRVYSMIKDTSDILWIGTADGLNKLDLKHNQFVSFSPLANGYGWIGDSYVASLVQDKAGFLWYGTDQYGAVRLSLETGVADLDLRKETTKDELTSNTIISLRYDDKENNLWLGTWAGVNGYSLDTGALRHIVKDDRLPPGKSLRDNRIFALELDRKQSLWIGTFGGGLSVWDPEADELHHLPIMPEENGVASDEVFSLRLSESGHIWMGGIKGGLSRIDPDSYQVDIFPLYSSAHEQMDTTIFSIFESDNETLWLGTSDGLAKFTVPDGQTTFYREKQGLCNNTVLGVLRDASGFFWLSTLKGLSRFDPETETFQNFHKTNGLPDDGFEQGSYLMLSDGRMLFGTGSAGFVMFDPGQVTANSHLPRAYLSSVKSQKHEYVKGPKHGEVRVVVPYTERSLSFQFDLLEFTNPTANLLMYKLEGMDESFSEPTNRNYVTYTNLPAGNYTLKVRLANADGNWTTEKTLLELTVEKPWWQTWPFIVVACFAVIGISNLLQSSVRKLVTIYRHWRHTKFFSHFRILEKIGQGGMGAVFLVDDLNTGKRYALKRLNEDSIVDEQTKERFLLETLLAEKLDHPNIVRVHEKGEVDGVLYFVMDHVSGMTFRELMKTANIPVLTAFSMVAALFEIVHEIHVKGVVHRDLKPENLMITNDLSVDGMMNTSLGITAIREHLRILDFGIAKLTDAGTLTRTDMLVGSVSYLPPEYISGDVRNHPTIDYYSLGITLYEMVTGTSPYQQEDVFQTMLQITKGEMTDPIILNPDLTRAQADFVRKLIAPDLGERLTDISVILQRINELLEMKDDRA